jgi:hypothetical protein
VEDLSGTVENGKVAVKWKVAYTEDNDDSTSGKEMAEKGYTLPEYHFAAEYDGTESGPEPVLEVKDWAKLTLKDEEAGEILGNKKYTVYLFDGTTKTGTTDENGIIHEKGLPVEDIVVRINTEEQV